MTVDWLNEYHTNRTAWYIVGLGSLVVAQIWDAQSVLVLRVIVSMCSFAAQILGFADAYLPQLLCDHKVGRQGDAATPLDARAENVHFQR